MSNEQDKNLNKVNTDQKVDPDLVSPEEITDRLDEGYKYGFRDDVENVRILPKCLNEGIVREISNIKNEP